MKIELLYFSGCPTFKNAEDVLTEAMKDCNIIRFNTNNVRREAQ